MITGNADALEKMIAALDGLTDEHAAIVEYARSLARTMDIAEVPDAKIFGEYRQLLKLLLEVGRKENADELAELLARLSGLTTKKPDA